MNKPVGKVLCGKVRDFICFHAGELFKVRLYLFLTKLSLSASWKLCLEGIDQECRWDLGLRVSCLHVSLTPLMPDLPLLLDPSCLYLPFPSSSDVSPHSMGCTEGAEDNRKQSPSRTVFDICPTTYLFGLTFKLRPYLTNHLQRLSSCHLCNNTMCTLFTF